MAWVVVIYSGINAVDEDEQNCLYKIKNSSTELYCILFYANTIAQRKRFCFTSKNIFSLKDRVKNDCHSCFLYLSIPHLSHLVRIMALRLFQKMFSEIE